MTANAKNKKTVKYPLTDEAKQFARDLVQAWNDGQIEQLFNLVGAGAGGDEGPKSFLIFPQTGFAISRLNLVIELAQYHLLNIGLAEKNWANDYSWQVLLLQELKNAVDSGFDVSDYFLTLNAVGTIVYGNLEVKEGAIFQSAASNTGDVNQTIEQLADEIQKLLGQQILDQEKALKEAIEALKTPDQFPRAQKCGKVIEELGRCMGHLTNAAGAIGAVMLIGSFLS